MAVSGALNQCALANEHIQRSQKKKPNYLCPRPSNIDLSRFDPVSQTASEQRATKATELYDIQRNLNPAAKVAESARQNNDQINFGAYCRSVAIRKSILGLL
jgi:hypothetical protein